MNKFHQNTRQRTYNSLSEDPRPYKGSDVKGLASDELGWIISKDASGSIAPTPDLHHQVINEGSTLYHSFEDYHKHLQDENTIHYRYLEKANLPKDVPIDILNNPNLEIYVCLVRINEECSLPFLEFGLHGMTTMNFLSIKKEVGGMLDNPNSLIEQTTLLLQDIFQIKILPEQYYGYIHVDQTPENNPNEDLSDNQPQVEDWLEKFAERPSSGDKSQPIYNSLLPTTLLSTSLLNHSLFLIFHVTMSPTTHMGSMMTLKEDELDHYTISSEDFRWFILDEIMYEHKRCNIDTNVVNFIRQHPVIQHVQRSIKEDWTIERTDVPSSNYPYDSEPIQIFSGTKKDHRSKGSWRTQTDGGGAELRSQTIEWPQSLFMCRKDNKDDTLYHHVLMDKSLIDLPMDHDMFGEGYLFTDSLVLASTPSPLNIQRYAVFTTIHDRYILRDIKHQTKEQLDAFVNKYTHADVLTIFFREDGIRLWHVKSADHFTRLTN